MEKIKEMQNILTAGIAINPVPISANMQRIILDNPVTGETSPYPMVVIETCNNDT